MPRMLVLSAAILFGTTGTARALGPDASSVAVGAARVAVGAALLSLIAWRAASGERAGRDGAAAGAERPGRPAASLHDAAADGRRGREAPDDAADGPRVSAGRRRTLA